MDIRANKVIGENLCAMRKHEGISQVDAAKRLHMTQPSLSKLESGERTVQLSELFGYAALLGVEPEQIYRTLVCALQENPTTAHLTTRLTKQQGPESISLAPFQRHRDARGILAAGRHSGTSSPTKSCAREGI